MNINLNNISEQFNFNDSKKANTERASTKLE